MFIIKIARNFNIFFIKLYKKASRPSGESFLRRWYIFVVYEHKILEWIKEEPTKKFYNIAMWLFVDKMSIHFEEDKIKAILFSTKSRKKVCWSTRDNYGDIKIKEYSKVAYLDCELDKNLSGEAKALKIIKKFDRLRLRFLFSKNRYLSLYLKRLLWNSL